MTAPARPPVSPPAGTPARGPGSVSWWRDVVVGGAEVLGAVAAAPLLRRRYLRWGTVPSEVAAVLPGDDLVPAPRLGWTRAVTVDAPVAAVWPWLVQIGQGRGGLYSFDGLENLLGCDVHSADRVRADLQDLQVGDEVRLHPAEGAPVYRVHRVEPPTTLVLLGGEGATRTTWQFWLRPVDGGRRTADTARTGGVRERREYPAEHPAGLTCGLGRPPRRPPGPPSRGPVTSCAPGVPPRSARVGEQDHPSGGDVVGATRQRVVVGVDGSAGARLALAWALAEAAGRGADVEVVSAFPVDFYWTDPFLLDGDRVAAIREDTGARARRLVDELRAEDGIADLPGMADVGVTVTVCAGAAAAHLVQRSEGAALLVVGNRGRGAVRSSLAGSVALHCAAHARCPVVVVHPLRAPAPEIPRVVVGLDDSDHARAALVAAAAQADRLGVHVSAVVAHEDPNYWSDLYAVALSAGQTEEQAHRRAEEIVTEVLGPEALLLGRVRVTAVRGHAAQVLVGEAEGASLLVVGSRSRNQLEGLALGSVALHCVMHAPCPVLVVHPRPRHAGTAPAQPAAAARAG